MQTFYKGNPGDFVSKDSSSDHDSTPSCLLETANISFPRTSIFGEEYITNDTGADVWIAFNTETMLYSTVTQIELL